MSSNFQQQMTRHSHQHKNTFFFATKPSFVNISAKTFFLTFVVFFQTLQNLQFVKTAATIYNRGKCFECMNQPRVMARNLPQKLPFLVFLSWSENVLLSTVWDKERSTRSETKPAFTLSKKNRSQSP